LIVEHIGVEPMTSWLPETMRDFPPDSIILYNTTLQK
jgi:hypothetical protein